MTKVYALFFLLSFFLFLYAVLVVPIDSVTTAHFFGTSYVLSERMVCWMLSLTALLFAVLYLFTKNLLYSSVWSRMHLICFIFLAINICAFSFLERHYFELLNHKNGMTSADVEAQSSFSRISEFFVGGMFILLIMQLLYPLNLILGIIVRKSQVEG